VRDVLPDFVVDRRRTALGVRYWGCANSLEYFNLSTQCFTSFEQDCIGAYHLKNYCFVITYLLEDEQELSLGMLDTSQTYL
jgi:hypothetical protein